MYITNVNVHISCGVKAMFMNVSIKAPMLNLKEKVHVHVQCSCMVAQGKISHNNFATTIWMKDHIEYMLHVCLFHVYQAEVLGVI